MLAAGEERLSRFPDDRGWDLTGLYHLDPDHPGTTYVRTGDFLSARATSTPRSSGSPARGRRDGPAAALLLETC
ncbi:beta-ketoacyl synthase N-terminal-like domain-containing protein [Streptomyces sp. KL116D]|uniref:beta-ketoacyl synthase N-terminal-like domain-containing protein n=1 Tax=Streptomyces sp. KL116D TaxID=3045152 RepID=UPI0035575324